MTLMDIFYCKPWVPILWCEHNKKRTVPPIVLRTMNRFLGSESSYNYKSSTRTRLQSVLSDCKNLFIVLRTFGGTVLWLLCLHHRNYVSLGAFTPKEPFHTSENYWRNCPLFVVFVSQELGTIVVSRGMFWGTVLAPTPEQVLPRSLVPSPPVPRTVWSESS